jgi:hypothetical protein
MILGVIDIGAINERTKQRRREACENADGWDLAHHGWSDGDDCYIVVLCPACQQRTAAWYDASDGLPASIADNCDHCDKEFELKVQWETVSNIIDVEFP